MTRRRPLSGTSACKEILWEQFFKFLVKNRLQIIEPFRLTYVVKEFLEYVFCRKLKVGIVERLKSFTDFKCLSSFCAFLPQPEPIGSEMNVSTVIFFRFSGEFWLAIVKKIKIFLKLRISEVFWLTPPGDRRIFWMWISQKISMRNDRKVEDFLRLLILGSFCAILAYAKLLSRERNIFRVIFGFYGQFWLKSSKKGNFSPTLNFGAFSVRPRLDPQPLDLIPWPPTTGGTM